MSTSKRERCYGTREQVFSDEGNIGDWNISYEWMPPCWKAYGVQVKEFSNSFHPAKEIRFIKGL